MLRRALGYGITTMRGHLGLAVLAWAIGAAIAGVASAPVWWWLGATATRPDADGLLQRLDPATIVDLMIANGPAASTGLIVWTLLALIVAAIVAVFLNAGLVAVVVTPDGRPVTARFLAGGRTYFWRFLRLAIAAALTGAVLFVLLLALAALLGRIFLYGAVFTIAALWLAAALGAFLFTTLVVFTAMDYARIHLAARDSRQALRTWFASLRFVLRHLLSTTTLAISFTAIAAVALLAYLLIAAPATSAIGIAMLFVVRQAIVLVRMAARIGLLGAEHELWRMLMPPPPPPPEPAPVPVLEPPSVPPDAIEASI